MHPPVRQRHATRLYHGVTSHLDVRHVIGRDGHFDQSHAQHRDWVRQCKTSDQDQAGFKTACF